MTQEKMTAMLSETISVTAGEAMEALEARGWNLLEAALLLQARARARRAETAEASRRKREGTLSGALRALAARFSRARAEARNEITAMSQLPARVIAPLMILPSGYAGRCW